jgi:hypothetical protein
MIRLRIFPLRRDYEPLKEITDKLDINLLTGAGLPKIDGTLDGFSHTTDGYPRMENYSWMTAYIEVETDRQAQIVLAYVLNADKIKTFTTPLSSATV